MITEEGVMFYLVFSQKSFPQDSKSLEWSPLRRLRSDQGASIHWFLHSPNVASYQMSLSLESEPELLTWQMSYVPWSTYGPRGVHNEDKTRSPTLENIKWSSDGKE